MTNRLRYVMLTVMASLALSARAGDVVSVDIRLLAENQPQLIGQHIVVHGCLVMTPHGQFIEPCGNKDWHQSTLVWDPNNLGIDAIGKLGASLATKIEGDFSGVVIARAVDWPQQGNRVYLELESIANAGTYEP